MSEWDLKWKRVKMQFLGVRAAAAPGRTRQDPAGPGRIASKPHVFIGARGSKNGRQALWFGPTDMFQDVTEVKPRKTAQRWQWKSYFSSGQNVLKCCGGVLRLLTLINHVKRLSTESMSVFRRKHDVCMEIWREMEREEDCSLVVKAFSLQKVKEIIHFSKSHPLKDATSNC